MTSLACLVSSVSVYVSDKLCLFVKGRFGDLFFDGSLWAIGCLDLGFALPLTFDSSEALKIG